MRLHINPETIRWNWYDKSIKCRTADGQSVYIPRTEVTCQNNGVVQNWETHMIQEKGLNCVTEREEGGTISASRAKAQIEDFQKLELWKKGEFEVTGITPWGLFTVPKHSDLVSQIAELRANFVSDSTTPSVVSVFDSPMDNIQDLQLSKKLYRRIAMLAHPDRGGDELLFNYAHALYVSHDVTALSHLLESLMANDFHSYI